MDGVVIGVVSEVVVVEIEVVSEVGEVAVKVVLPHLEDVGGEKTEVGEGGLVEFVVVVVVLTQLM